VSGDIRAAVRYRENGLRFDVSENRMLMFFRKRVLGVMPTSLTNSTERTLYGLLLAVSGAGARLGAGRYAQRVRFSSDALLGWERTVFAGAMWGVAASKP